MPSVDLVPTTGTQSRPDSGWAHWIETRTWVLSLLLMVATVALYYPVHWHPFVNYDDTVYVTENVHVQAGLEWDTVKWAFTTFEQANWHPLTWLSHALDCQLFELGPAGPHDVNLAVARAECPRLVLGTVSGHGFCWAQFHGGRIVCPAPH